MAADKDKSGDVVWAVIAAALFGVPAIVLSAASDGWDRASTWLLAHHVLAPAVENPVLVVPGTHGAGLDWVRIGIGLGALAVLTLTIRLVANLAYSGLARRGHPSRPER
jgi:hypothetical protein